MVRATNIKKYIEQHHHNQKNNMGYFTLFQKVVHYTCTFNVYKHLKIRLTARMIFSGKRIHCSELLLAVINMVLQIAGLYPFPRASARG